MKLGLMQPYFFPHIEYFSLIENCDYFIVFDTPQFVRRGWTERNRIIKANGDFSYIKVPLIKAPRDTSIIDMRIDNSHPWKDKIISQLEVYRDKAPYFEQVLGIISSCFKNEDDSISKLNENIIRTICCYLGINTKIDVLSEMGLDLPPPNLPDEWALNICKKLSFNNYVNASGGYYLYDPVKYKENGVNLFLIEQPVLEYKQFELEFTPGLSILDTMMFNSPENILTMIKKSKLNSPLSDALLEKMVCKTT
ncbi:MAG: WbqC family protein [Psychromonas sp.]